MSELIEARRPDPLRVVIVGGGVAAIEGLLALRALAGHAVTIELVAPDEYFTFRPTSVGEPFGLGPPRRYALADIAAEHEARLVRDSFRALDGAGRTLATEGGGEIEFDALLLAVGARRSEALPGALTFMGSGDGGAFRSLLEELEQGNARRLAFVVPPDVRWPMALYELALLTAAHLAAHRVTGAELTFVTHEQEPLGLFGQRASDSVRELLAQAGIALRAGYHAHGFEDGRLDIDGHRDLELDAVVALPKLDVPDLEGVPQGRRGFIPINDHGKVDDLYRVYAAGDATWFPIKQGGVAAQQADAAAASIAAAAGADVTPRPFRPVLRGVLLTGSAPHYMRSEIGDRDHSSASGPDALWWPPGKIAGRYLAPYLARQQELGSELADLEPVPGDARLRHEDHGAAVELALAAADADARWRDYKGALRWLDVAEQLTVVLSAEYAEKRGQWQRARDGVVVA